MKSMSDCVLNSDRHVSRHDHVACVCSSDVRLTPAMVDGEVNILKQLSGRDEEKYVLESIAFYGGLSCTLYTSSIYCPKYNGGI